MQHELTRLQRRVRYLELLACLLFVSCAGVALTASRSPAITTLRADRFEMVDASGRVRGYWRMSDDGSPSFTLYDAEGKPRVALGAAPSGASEMTVQNAEGQRLRVRVEADGSTPYVAASR